MSDRWTVEGKTAYKLTVRVLCDNEPREKPFVAYLFGQTKFNQNSVLEAAAKLYKELKGEIFIGSWNGGGVYYYDEKSQPKGQANFTKLNGFSDGMIAFMLEDKIGNIWVGTRNTDLCRFDGKTFTSFSE